MCYISSVKEWKNYKALLVKDKSKGVDKVFAPLIIGENEDIKRYSKRIKLEQTKAPLNTRSNAKHEGTWKIRIFRKNIKK